MADSQFPYTADEGNRIVEIARHLVNAGLAHDELRRAKQLAELRQYLDELIGKYGEHPILIETQADYADTFEESMALYEKAKTDSKSMGLPLLSICLSMALLVLNERDGKSRALELLQECQDEVCNANEYELWKIEEIKAACGEIANSQ